MKVYLVEHLYSVDGGYGDAVWTSDIVACFGSKKDADEFVEKYSNEHVYDTPYDDLMCGDLKISEINLINHYEAKIMKWKWIHNWHFNDELKTEEEVFKMLKADIIETIESSNSFKDEQEDYRKCYIQERVKELAYNYSVTEDFVRELLEKKINMKGE